MAFRFNFQIEETETTDAKELPGQVAVSPTKEEIIDAAVNITKEEPEPYLPPTEVFINEQNYKKVEEYKRFKTMHCDEKRDLRYISARDIEKKLKRITTSDSGVKRAILASCDLVPGDYEGGLKIWEGTWDLLNYLSSTDVQFNESNVLEIGCGTGLPGIYAFKKGSKVHFQDFNHEVLQFITIPNLLLSLTNPVSEKESLELLVLERLNSCRFIAGDWANVNQFLGSELKDDASRYDYILTSDTIYNSANHRKLYELMKATLKTTGKIYLSAKCHYFGVGGGTQQFQDLIEADGMFDVKECWSTDEGVRRQILMISRKQ